MNGCELLMDYSLNDVSESIDAEDVTGHLSLNLPSMSIRYKDSILSQDVTECLPEQVSLWIVVKVGLLDTAEYDKVGRVSVYAARFEHTVCCCMNSLLDVLRPSHHDNPAMRWKGP